MASNEDSLNVTNEYRRQQLALRAQMILDLQRIWPAMDWERLDETFPAWFEMVRLIVNRDARRSQNLSAAYLTAFREAEGVSGTAAVVFPAAVNADRLETSMRVTSVVAVKRSVQAGKTPGQAMRDAFVQSTGAATRHMLNAGRDTVRLSTVRDRDAVGWRRVGGGDTCPFCRMLIHRDAVYTRSSVDFASHDHCSCQAEPFYGGERINVRDEYQQTSREITDADRARVRSWIANNLPD